jgi:hypothetical protein
LNLITQLLPGLRDIRGPLIAGYLWLFTAWLLFAGLLPKRGDAGVYAHAFEAGNALGRVGLLTAVSVGAYLIGSLIQAVPGWIAYNSQRLGQFVVRRFSADTANRGSQLGGAIDVLGSPPIFAPTEFRSIDGDQRTRWVLKELVADRLKESRDNLEAVLRNAGGTVQDAAERRDDGGDRNPCQAIVAIEASGSPKDGWKTSRIGALVDDREHLYKGEYSLPSISARRDFFGERRSIQTRLIETAPHAGSEVDRLYAESELRFTIALPLATMMIVLAAKSGDAWWLGLLLVVVGLLTHSMVLRKHAGRELVEVLRSRLSVGELDQVTPAFSRYEEDAERLIAALEGIGWYALGMLARQETGAKAMAPDSGGGRN